MTPLRLSALLLISMAASCLLAPRGFAAQLNLATVSCAKYENEIVGTTDAAQAPPDASQASPDTAHRGPAPAAAGTARPDAINTVMWLFGFSVAKGGDHVMYGDALASFGFALDAECKNNPATALLQAVTSVKPNRDKPMDLAALNCDTFESRHADSVKSDPESARTIMMWLYGFAIGLSGNHVLDTDGVDRFAGALRAECSRNPNDSLFDALSGVYRPAKR